jgi:hypothetical protein
MALPIGRLDRACSLALLCLFIFGCGLVFVLKPFLVLGAGCIARIRGKVAHHGLGGTRLVRLRYGDAGGDGTERKRDKEGIVGSE